MPKMQKMFVADLYILIYFIFNEHHLHFKNYLGAILISQIIQPYFSDIECILLVGNGKYYTALTREKVYKVQF